MTHDLLQIVPSEIPRPTKHGTTYYVKGDFLYFHYCCDNHNDVVSRRKNTNRSELDVAWLLWISFDFIARNRDGAVHIVHCSRCAHGSQRIATQSMRLRIMNRRRTKFQRSKRFNRHWSISMTNRNRFWIRRTGLVHWRWLFLLPITFAIRINAIECFARLFHTDFLCDRRTLWYIMPHSAHPKRLWHSQIFEYHQILFPKFWRSNHDGRRFGCIIEVHCGHSYRSERCILADCGKYSKLALHDRNR